MVSREKIGKRCAKFLKRLVDIAGSCLGIAAALPFFIILPIIIKIESEGPVIHKRKVVGENDFAFFAYKFRTMVRDAEKILEKDRELKTIVSEAYKTAEEIKGKADAEAAAIYSSAYDKTAQSRQLYSFLKSMEAYEKTFDDQTYIILSTDSEFFKYLKDMD